MDRQKTQEPCPTGARSVKAKVLRCMRQRPAGDAVTRPTGPPPGLIEIPPEGAIRLLAEAEFAAGSTRGKWSKWVHGGDCTNTTSAEVIPDAREWLPVSTNRRDRHTS